MYLSFPQDISQIKQQEEDYLISWAACCRSKNHTQTTLTWTEVLVSFHLQESNSKVTLVPQKLLSCSLPDRGGLLSPGWIFNILWNTNSFSISSTGWISSFKHIPYDTRILREIKSLLEAHTKPITSCSALMNKYLQNIDVNVFVG